MCPLKRFAFSCLRSTGDEPKKKKHRTKKKKKSAKKRHDLGTHKAEDGAASAVSEKGENDTEDMEVNEGGGSDESDNDGDTE